MPKAHSYMNFKEEDDFSSAIIGFSKYLRQENFLVGFDASIDALDVIAESSLWDKEALRILMKPIYCGTYEDHCRFDLLFDAYFKERLVKFKNKTVFKNQQRTNPIATAVMLGFGMTDGRDQEEAKNMSGGNAEERLRRTDFSHLGRLDSQELDHIAKKLWKEMSLRMRKKSKQSTQKGIIDIRRTIRNNASNGFELLKLIRKDKKPQKHKLILLLDVSGSMDKYSFYLLRFMWSLKNHFRGLEAFIFSTRIVRISDLLQRNDLEATLDHVKSNVRVWGSGTTMGNCLKQFNAIYAKRVMQSRNICIILSDGLDTGPTDELLSELSEIKRKTAKLIWLNPLKGSKGYQPIQKSMNLVLDHLDVFKAANTMNSLLELEKILVDV